MLDPLVIDRHLDPYRPGSRKLAAVCAHHGVPVGDAHTAGGDALAAVRLAWRLARVHPEVGDADLAELQAAQACWHDEWCAHYEAYRRGRGDEIAVPRGWPLRAVAEEATRC